MMKVGFYRLSDEAKMPVRAHEGDACHDVYAIEDVNISPRETKVLLLGFKVAVPKGWELLVRPRSGLALENNLTVLNSPGTIDSGYRGEVGVILHNAGMCHVLVLAGTKIAQLSLKRVQEMEFVEVKSEEMLGQTERGEDGFGSTDGD